MGQQAEKGKREEIVKWDQMNEIPDRGETSDIPSLPSVE